MAAHRGFVGHGHATRVRSEISPLLKQKGLGLLLGAQHHSSARVKRRGARTGSEGWWCATTLPTRHDCDTQRSEQPPLKASTV